MSKKTLSTKQSKTVTTVITFLARYRCEILMGGLQMYFDHDEQLLAIDGPYGWWFKIWIRNEYPGLVLATSRDLAIHKVENSRELYQVLHKVI